MTLPSMHKYDRDALADHEQSFSPSIAKYVVNRDVQYNV